MYRNGEIIRLAKGLSKNETISVLGEPFKIEHCKNELNEKLVFKIHNGRLSGALYSIMFLKDELVYVAKSN